VQIHPETGRPETEHERVDRNLTELLNELRVALPGVQVLFAFLLVVPFNTRFIHVTGLQKNVYFVTLLCAAAASVCLIAPTVHHRIEFRLQDKEYIVLVSNKLAIVGLTFLAVAMTGAILLVTDVLFGGVTSGIATGLVALAFAVLWYSIPLQRLRRRRRAE
jgi:Family of unknown function (DUF6328)